MLRPVEPPLPDVTPRATSPVGYVDRLRREGCGAQTRPARNFKLAGNRCAAIASLAPDAMPSAETENHCRLKALALAWAQSNGYSICGLEVRVPRSGYRADVAAVGRGAAGRTAVFECKQARADLLKDAHAEVFTRARLAELTQRRRALEELLAVHRPDLRRGEALWPEYDAWDFSSVEHGAYRALLAEIERVQRRVLRGTKFSKMFRYRCADFLYLVVEDGIFAEAEIPAGWGLLVRGGDELRLARPPADLDAAPQQRLALLETTAMAGTRAVNRAAGVVLARRDWTSAELLEK